jgi:lysophospholipase L1-like esterase
VKWAELTSTIMKTSTLKICAKAGLDFYRFPEIMSYSGTTDADLAAADLITISLGQNNINTAIGTVSDTPSNASNASVHASAKWVAEYLLNVSPKSTIVFITPTPSRLLEAQLRPIADALINVGNLYSIPVLNLNRISGFNSFNYSYFYKDDVHPNGIGYKRMSKITSSFLESL